MKEDMLEGCRENEKWIEEVLARLNPKYSSSWRIVTITIWMVEWILNKFYLISPTNRYSGFKLEGNDTLMSKINQKDNTFLSVAKINIDIHYIINVKETIVILSSLLCV